ncbi:CHAT domain-containing protein [Thermocatellispora tengchongensis]|uniref:CHAT domain-containing protein n=1 Tax=Thermocatellispora tengchongensis TaxID=1073253 RepID=UPI003629F8D8
MRLAEALLARADPGDAEAALGHLTAALESAAPKDRLPLLDNLWRVRLQLFQSDGDLALLTAAISDVRRAAAEPQSPEERAERLGYLGRMHRWRYQETGHEADLEGALQALVQAELLVTDSPARLPYLGDIAALLLDRFERKQIIDDLERAIDILESLTALATDEPSLATWLANLANALHHRVEISQSAEDSARAVGAADRAFRLAQGTRDRSVAACNLAAALIDRHQYGDGGVNDLDEAIVLCADAIEGAGELRPLARQVLGVAYGLRFEARHDEGDLRQAIELRQTSLDELGADSPARMPLLLDLGRCLRHRHQLRQDPADLARGLAALREVVGRGMETHRGAALKAAELLVDWLAERGAWAEAAEPARIWSAALAAQFGAQVTVQHKARYLHVDQQMPGRVGVVLAHAGDAEAAAVAMERGRTQLFADTLGDGEGVTFARIAEAARDTPLVYLTSSPWGGLALAVVDGEVRVRHLPDLTEEALSDWSSGLYWARARRAGDPERWRDVLDWTCEWLWTACVRDVLEVVGEPEELVLIPCGPLTTLPLHAAWTPDPTAPTGRCYALDRKLITYAPGARMLHRARTAAAAATADPLVTIEDPEPVANPLPFARAETGAAGALWPQAVSLRGDDVTRDAVRDVLPGAGVIHFAGHGRADIVEPARSGLGLAGGELLAMDDLAGMPLRARLAVLSACETAVPGLDIPDEVIGLPTAMLQAGAAGVIGSLWAVPDVSSALLMIMFYRGWRLDGLSPAAALRAAQRTVRDTSAKGWVELFEPLLDGDGWLPAEVAEMCWEQVILADPGELVYASPSGWASFAFTGA